MRKLRILIVGEFLDSDKHDSLSHFLVEYVSEITTVSRVISALVQLYPQFFKNTSYLYFSEEIDEFGENWGFTPFYDLVIVIYNHILSTNGRCYTPQEIKQLIDPLDKTQFVFFLDQNHQKQLPSNQNTNGLSIVNDLEGFTGIWNKIYRPGQMNET